MKARVAVSDRSLASLGRAARAYVCAALALPALLFVACGRQNALVDGECADGYTSTGNSCVEVCASCDGYPSDVIPSDGSPDVTLQDGDATYGDAPVDAFACDDGLTYCAGSCVDTTSDPFNCGSCGVVCPSLLCANSQCVGAVAGSIVAIGHDYEISYSAAQAKLLGNALLLSPAQTLKVRSYEQYAKPAAVTNVKAILNATAQAANRTIAYTVATQPSDVSSGMTALNTDVLVVYDQPAAPASSLAGIGASWTTALGSFTHVGGVVIVLDGQGGANPQMPGLMSSAQLLDVTADTAISSGTALTVVAPADAVGLGVVSPYGAGKHSVYFACNEANAPPVTYVVEDPANDAGLAQPVVVHKIAP